MKAANMTRLPSQFTQPSVGIILTTYNGQDYLVDQLDSLLAQVGVSLHIYVFDDQSSDETMAILKRYADANNGVFSLFQNLPNSGGTGLNIFRNVANVPETHEFFALADQDDIWLPDKLFHAIETLKQEQSHLYFSNLLAWDGQEEIFGVVKKNAPLRTRDHLFGGGSAGCTYVMSAPFFRHIKEVLTQTSLEGVRRISHDWIIYFLARHDDFKVSASSDALIKYRIHADSQYGEMSMGGIAALRRKFKMLRSGFLHEQVRNTLLFAREGTEDRDILLAFQESLSKRLSVFFRYRSSLARERSRLAALVIASTFLF